MKKLLLAISLVSFLLFISCKTKGDCTTTLYPVYSTAEQFINQLTDTVSNTYYTFASIPFDSNDLRKINCGAWITKADIVRYKYFEKLPKSEMLFTYKYKYELGSVDTTMFWDTMFIKTHRIDDALINVGNSRFILLPSSFRDLLYKAMPQTCIINSLLYHFGDEGTLYANSDGQKSFYSWSHFDFFSNISPNIHLASRFYQAFDGSDLADPNRYEALTLHALADDTHGYAFYSRVINIKIDGQHYPIVYATVFPMKRWGYAWLLDTKTFAAEFQIDYAQIGFDQQRTELQINHVSASAKSENRNHVFVGTGSQINDVALLSARCIIRLEDGTKDTIQIQR